MNSPFHPSSHGRPRISFGTGPLTPGIKGIIFTCAGVFFLQALVPGNWLEFSLGLSSEGLLGRYFLWQPVTYLFLHTTGNLFHLVFNMLMLWMFGGELERRWGTQSFLQYYFLCGVGAGLASVAVDVLSGFLREGPLLSPSRPTIGASGAVYGLLAAQAILYPNRLLLVFLIFPMRMRVAVFLMAAITLWVAIGSAKSGSGTPINHVAHLGGMALGWAYLHRAWNPMRLWHDWRWQRRRKRYHVVSDIKDDDHDRFH